MMFQSCAYKFRQLARHYQKKIRSSTRHGGARGYVIAASVDKDIVAAGDSCAVAIVVAFRDYVPDSVRLVAFGNLVVGSGGDGGGGGGVGRFVHDDVAKLDVVADSIIVDLVPD